MSIEDRPLSKPSETLTSPAAVDLFEEEMRLWAYMDVDAWINE